jgi:hypothetical protein
VTAASTDGKTPSRSFPLAVMAAKHNKRRHMRNDTPHTLDHFSAQDRAIGRRITHSFGHWLEKCESHDSWHELPEEQRKQTLANVAAFLDDYADFEPVR